MKYLSLILLVSLFSCKFFEKESEEDVMARVYDRYLYQEDIQDLLSKLKGDKDSALIVNNYISNWVRQELLLQKAELNLREDQKNFQKLLEDYRRSLLIYAFQKEWVRFHLDTNIKAEEITKYYNENQSNFELKKNIVKMKFAKVFKTAPKLNKLDKLIQSDEEEDKAEFRDYCLQYAADYNENDSIWIEFDKVLDKVPMNIPNQEDFLRKHKFYVHGDSVNYYLLFIKEFKIKNDISPLSFEQEKIRNIIINQRKLELLADMKKDLFETALEKGNAEIYER